jgi:glycosyltransferase involved in cell wall biosynthesis
MRIGLVSPSWPPDLSGNGITTFTKYMKLGLEEEGHETQIIALKGFKDARNTHIVAASKPKLRLHTFLKNIKSRNDFKLIEDRLVDTIVPIVKQNLIDVLIMEESFGWAHRIQEAIGIPVVVALHGPWHIIRRHLPHPEDLTGFDSWRIQAEQRALESCAAVFAPSSYVLSETLEFYRLQNKHHWVLPNPFIANNNHKIKNLSKINNQSILFVGRYDYLKGADIVIAALSNLRNIDKQINFDFVGKDIGFTNSNSRFQKSSIRDIELFNETKSLFNYHGFLPPKEIVRLRQKDPITVVGSRFENYPYSVVEALSTGGLVVAPDVGGIGEIIQDGENGFLFKKENANHLAETIEKSLALSANTRKKISINAIKAIEEKNDPRKNASNLVKFINTI